MDIEQEIKYLVKTKMGWTDAAIENWYNARNIFFNDMSPKEMVDEGIGKELVSYIERINS